MKAFLLLGLLAALAWIVHLNRPHSPKAKKPVTHGRVTSGMAGYKYLFFQPDHYQTNQGTWPLIIFLHGASPDDKLEKLKYFGPIKYGLGHESFPFLVVAPATSNGWYLQPIEILLGEIGRLYPNLDSSRVYLTGYSMGGQAAWMLAEAWPQRFAAVAVVAGAGNPAQARTTLRKTPAWVFHGEQDKVVPVQYGKAMAAALASAGGEVKSTFIPNCGHEAWLPAYSNPELYQWFLDHRKEQPDILKN